MTNKQSHTPHTNYITTHLNHVYANVRTIQEVLRTTLSKQGYYTHATLGIDGNAQTAMSFILYTDTDQNSDYTILNNDLVSYTESVSKI